MIREAVNNLKATNEFFLNLNPSGDALVVRDTILSMKMKDKGYTKYGFYVKDENLYLIFYRRTDITREVAMVIEERIQPKDVSYVELKLDGLSYKIDNYINTQQKVRFVAEEGDGVDEDGQKYGYYLLKAVRSISHVNNASSAIVESPLVKESKKRLWYSLTEEDKFTLASDFHLGKTTIKAICNKYGVSYPVVSKVVNDSRYTKSIRAKA